MVLDTLTIGVASACFIVFLLIKFVLFRRVAPECLLKSLLVSVIAVMALPALVMVLLGTMGMITFVFKAWVSAMILSSLLEGLMCFVYVLCFFGPYETSVRMRLVREIAQAGPQGISAEELAGRYNAQTIVMIRLKRLIGSGDIVAKDGGYQMGHKRNFFFLFDTIAQQIKKWIET